MDGTMFGQFLSNFQQRSMALFHFRGKSCGKKTEKRQEFEAERGV